MVDPLARKIRRARSTRPIFADRVTVVADASRAIEYTALAWPAAYVTCLSEEASDQAPGANEHWQRVNKHIGVIVGLEATADIRGHSGAVTIDDCRVALCRAVYNWSPDYEKWGAIAYEGYRLLEVSRAATFWLLTFQSFYDICGEEGEVEEQFEALDDFHGANMGVDFIDPHDRGAPPSQQYDPRRGPPPWRTGPEGRIEMRFAALFPPPPPPP